MIPKNDQSCLPRIRVGHIASQVFLLLLLSSKWWFSKVKKSLAMLTQIIPVLLKLSFVLARVVPNTLVIPNASPLVRGEGGRFFGYSDQNLISMGRFFGCWLGRFSVRCFIEGRVA